MCEVSRPVLVAVSPSSDQDSSCSVPPPEVEAVEVVEVKVSEASRRAPDVVLASSSPDPSMLESPLAESPLESPLAESLLVESPLELSESLSAGAAAVLLLAMRNLLA